MKKIRFALIFALLAVVMAGCGGGAASGSNKTYDLDGRKVSFMAPSAPWEEEVLKENDPTLEDQTLGDEKGMPVGVTFRKKEGDGFFSVAVMDQNEDIKFDPKTQKELSRSLIELENDQNTLDYIAMWVDKRDGDRIKEEYIKVAGVNAFHMVFEIGKPEERMKGEQVHFTKEGTHYVLSMLGPVKEYNSQVGIFQNMVSSFQILQGKSATAASAAAAPTAAASP